MNVLQTIIHKCTMSTIKRKIIPWQQTHNTTRPFMPTSSTSSPLNDYKKSCLVVIDGWGLSGHSPASSDAIAAAKNTLHDRFPLQLPEFRFRSARLGCRAARWFDGKFGSWTFEFGRWKDCLSGYCENWCGNGRGKDGKWESVYHQFSIIALLVQRHNIIYNYIAFILLGNKRIHFVGLVSDGGVHSHLRHLKSLIEITKRRLGSNSEVRAFIHAITDGRDTAPCSAKKYLIDDLGEFLKMNVKDSRNWECLWSLLRHGSW